jgi:hypothetical protein
MIGVQLLGGLGNQLFQYALGRNIALRHQVLLQLDVSGLPPRPGVTRRDYALDPFGLSASIAKTGLSIPRAPLFIPERLWMRIEGCLPVRWHRSIVEKSFQFDPSVLKAGSKVLLKGYWQDERYFSSIAQTIRQDLLRKRQFTAAASELAREMQQEHSVSVHVRRGDYVNDPATASYHGTVLPEYYAQAMQRFAATASAKYFVFSDDIEWVKKNLAFNKSVIFVSGDYGLQDHEELWLMSLCHHHIIANSSFSWWGAWLGERKESLIICPRRWFATDSKKNDHPAPQRWLHL